MKYCHINFELNRMIIWKIRVRKACKNIDDNRIKSRASILNAYHIAYITKQKASILIRP